MPASTTSDAASNCSIVHLTMNAQPLFHIFYICGAPRHGPIQTHVNHGPRLAPNCEVGDVAFVGRGPSSTLDGAWDVGGRERLGWEL